MRQANPYLFISPLYYIAVSVLQDVISVINFTTVTPFNNLKHLIREYLRVIQNLKHLKASSMKTCPALLISNLHVSSWR